MALPPTGSTITIGEIRDYFVSGGYTSTYVLGVLGQYIGVSRGTILPMSITFGGFYFP